MISLINKDYSNKNTSSSFILCPHCGIEVEMENLRDHSLQHKTIKNLHTKFVQTTPVEQRNNNINLVDLLAAHNPKQNIVSNIEQTRGSNKDFLLHSFYP